MNKFLILLKLTLALWVTSALAQTHDTLMWMDSQLPPDQFIGVDAEKRIGPSQWESITHTYQPFKTSVDRSAKQIFWRKDSLNPDDTFYGELFVYDSNFIELHTETFPFLPNVDTPGTKWDTRIDRFRLFQNVDNPSMGRVIAPRTLSQDWTYSQTINTYMCGISDSHPGYYKVDGFKQVNSGECPLYQLHVKDTAVTARIVSNYDVLEDGSSVAGSPNRLPAGTTDGGALRKFEQALIIEQVMFDKARERFIFGFNNGKYYGIIRWDSSNGSPGNWYVTHRTVAVRVLADSVHSFRFTGMRARGEDDHTARLAQ